MSWVILALLAGIGIGWLLRRANWINWAGRLLQPTVGLLLFLMGAAVGTERELIGRLPLLGAQALLITLLGLGGSLFAAAWVYRRFFRQEKEGRR